LKVSRISLKKTSIRKASNHKEIELWEEISQKCRWLEGNRACGVPHGVKPNLCCFDFCPRRIRFEWLHPTVKIMCDFGQCENASMVTCLECHADLCLDHLEKHLRTCGSGMDVYARMRFEQEILDGKKWKE
jgi:hypothetical protein